MFTGNSIDTSDKVKNITLLNVFTTRSYYT